MEEGKHARVVVLGLAVLIGVGLTSIPALGLSASPNDIVTVCPSGPPMCDYQTIQEGINTASAGDTVLVSPGVYTEQVTLKSGLVLESSGGPEETTITAIVGPVITASQTVSVSIRGLTISGLGVLTTSTGVEFSNSDVAIQNCVIEDFCGASGNEAQPDGEDAIAIRFKGSGTLVVVSTTIQNIAGGDSPADYVLVDGNGGNAIGVWASGVGRVTITDASIQSLSGGDASFESYYLDVQGGQAIGVRVEGDMDLTVEKSKFVDLVGGGPTGQIGPCYTAYNAGNPIGVQATGGTVILRNNLFRDFALEAAYDSEPAYAIHTSHTRGTYLERNTIAFLRSKYGYPESDRTQKASMALDSLLVPCPPISAVDVVGVASEDDALLHMTNNTVTNLSGMGPQGSAVSIRTRGTDSVKLVSNVLKKIVGGYSRGYRYDIEDMAVGVWIEEVEIADIDANVISAVEASRGASALYYTAYDGGGAVGIKLITVTLVTAINNSIGPITGGPGGSCIEEGYCPGAGNGGDAVALALAESSASLWHNVFYQTIPGDGGSPNGQPGETIGLRLTGDADVLAVNNALVGHGIGISSTSHNIPILGYNDLWDNDTDYIGVSPGANDIHVPPGFVDAANGDFHLLPGSPLIDAGTNAGAPGEDFEREPRPLDGNDDGLSIADIGADEYWQGLAGSAKTVNASIASSGDTLTYQMTLVNQSSYCDLSDVVLTDALPVGVTYVTGTLTGSAGTWRHTAGVITWTGTISAGQAATLTFNAVVAGDPAVPYAVVNQALLDDGVGKPRVLQAATLVNPLRSYLPAIFR